MDNKNEKNRAKRLLLIDDQPDVVNSLAICFRLAGHEVEVATTGMDGIDTASKLAPDIIFLDIGLPDVDGYDVAKKIRSLPDGRKMKIIALSGYPEESDELLADFDLYLIKPPNFGQLQKIISNFPVEVN